MIYEKFVEMLAEYTDVAASEIKKDSTFEELELADGDFVELIMAIEDEFEVSIESADELHTVGEVVEYIEENM